MELREKIKKHLDFIYKSEYDESIVQRIVQRVEQVKSKFKGEGSKWTEKDILLITYGDSIINDFEPTLQTLKSFLDKYFKNVLSYVHILPFFPYSSDDGFSVIDYKKVDPKLGNWSNVEDLSADYKLMFDLVINHISQYSDWYQNYLQGKKPGKNYFIEVDPELDLSAVVRPRSLPLLTSAETPNGIKHVWTTFSEDQIDLNFANPELLAEMVDIFLLYFERGATMIRLDAIAFLWKEIGSNCLHLPETHEFVKLLRDLTDYISPELILLTETNVPNKENLSYFGDNDEANMVYQFSLPPLLLQALFSSNSEYLTKWAATIPNLPETNTFFNFTASHDGIGVRPLEGLLPEEDFNSLVEGIRSFGGKISTKRNSDGTDSPYEMNITYFDAMKGTIQGQDEFQEARFICSQTIMMSMKGMPAFYIHSLLGTKNYAEGVAETGMNRTINRRKWKDSEIYPLLDGETSHSRVLNELKRIIQIRKEQKAFHPNAKQEVIELGNNLFSLSRDNGKLVSVSNISSLKQEVNLMEVFPGNNEILMELISGKTFSADTSIIELFPYQTVWLVRK